MENAIANLVVQIWNIEPEYFNEVLRYIFYPCVNWWKFFFQEQKIIVKSYTLRLQVDYSNVQDKEKQLNCDLLYHSWKATL